MYGSKKDAKNKAGSSNLLLFFPHLQLIDNLVAIIPGIELAFSGIIAEAGMGTISAGKIRECCPFRGQVPLASKEHWMRARLAGRVL